MKTWLTFEFCRTHLAYEREEQTECYKNTLTNSDEETFRTLCGCRKTLAPTDFSRRFQAERGGEGRMNIENIFLELQ
jgi:hypothetical protein